LSSQVEISMGLGSGIAVSPATAATVSGVQPGPADVVAVGQDLNLATIAFSILRNVDVPDGGTVNLTTWAAPLSSNLTINNLGADLANAIVEYSMAGFTFVSLTDGQSAGANQTYADIPVALQQPGDLHTLLVVASAGAGDGIRTQGTSFHASGDHTVTLGPSLANPTITLLPGLPNASYNIVLARQTEYADQSLLTFSQTGGSAIVIVSATAAYAGAAPTWDLAVPDLSTAGGFNVQWGLTPGLQTNWNVTAVGSSVVGGGAQAASHFGTLPN
jgi:hypothetical protein